MAFRLRYAIAATALLLGVQAAHAQVTSSEFRITNGTNRISLSGTPGASNTTYRFNAPTSVGVLLGSTWTSGTGMLDVTVSALPLGSTDYVTGILNVTNGGTGTTAIPANQILMGNSTGTGIVGAGSLTDGQVLIGTTGGTPVAATLTAGSGIQITNAAGAITLAVTGSALTGQTASATTVVGTQNYTITAPFDLQAGARVMVTVLDPAEDGIFATVTSIDAGTDEAVVHLSAPPSAAGRIDVLFQNP